MSYVIYGLVSQGTGILFILSSWLTHQATSSSRISDDKEGIHLPEVSSPSIQVPSPHSAVFSREDLSFVVQGFPFPSQDPSPSEPNTVSKHTRDISSGSGLTPLLERPSQTSSSIDQRNRRVHMRRLAIFIRRLAKTLATLNALTLIALSLIQFTGGFDNCYCNSSILIDGRERAYVIIEAWQNELLETAMWNGFIASAALSVGCSILFVGFVYTLLPSSKSQ